MRHLDHHCYCYLAIHDESVIGLAYLDPVNPVSAEIRHNTSPNVSRLIMRPTKAVIGHHASRGVPAVAFAWEVIDLPLAIKLGFVQIFAVANEPDWDAVHRIEDEFWESVRPFFREKRSKCPSWWKG